MPDEHEPERLRVKNFLTIRNASIEIGRFTVLIGPQASGKSVVAKLLYFFRGFLAQQIIRGVEQLLTAPKLMVEAARIFEELFPMYGWDETDFEIEYNCGEIGITVSHAATRADLYFKVEISPHLEDLYNRLCSDYRKMGADEILPSSLGSGALLQLRYRISQISDVFKQPTFIPAGRSFFPTLQKSIFSLLAGNVSIDPLVIEFGAVYGNAKSVYGSDDRRNRDLVGDETERILMGSYLRDNDQDWIVSGGRKVNLANASSGQQESLPMLIGSRHAEGLRGVSISSRNRRRICFPFPSAGWSTFFPPSIPDSATTFSSPPTALIS